MSDRQPTGKHGEPWGISDEVSHKIEDCHGEYVMMLGGEETKDLRIHAMNCVNTLAGYDPEGVNNLLMFLCKKSPHTFIREDSGGKIMILEDNTEELIDLIAKLKQVSA